MSTWHFERTWADNRSCLDNIAAEVNRSREDFISEYYNNYTAPSFPPAWKTLEVVSFGTLSKLFCNFKDNSVKKKVAKEFLLPQYLYLENWIKCIAVLRNACAHHARIWNRRFPTMPIMPKYLPSQWVVTGNFRPNKLYHQLCCLAYLEQSIAANGSFSKGKGKGRVGQIRAEIQEKSAWRRINLRYLRNLRDLFFVPQISQIHTDSWFGFKVTQMIGDVIPKTPQK